MAGSMEDADAVGAGGGAAPRSAAARRVAVPTLKQRIEELSAVVAQKRGEVEKALSSNLELRVRNAALQLYMRCFEELRAHRDAIVGVGGADGTGGGGGGGGAQPTGAGSVLGWKLDDDLLASVGLAHGADAAGADGGNSSGSGSGGSGSGSAGSAAALGEGADLLDKLPHLAPGRSLLHLEG